MAYKIDQAKTKLQDIINDMEDLSSNEDDRKNFYLDKLIDVHMMISNPDIKYVAWCSEDIVMRAKERDNTIVPDALAREILEDMIRHHDCTLGITWDTLDCYIDNYVYDGKLTAGDGKVDDDGD